SIAITTTLTSSSERIWPTSSRPTTSLAVSRSSKGFRPMSTSATHGQKSQLASSSTRSSKCRNKQLASVGEPFAVAAADELAEAARVVGEIAVAGFERAGVLYALKTAAEAEGLVGPIAGRRSRLAQPRFEPFSQRRGVGAFRRRRAGVASERGQGAQP